MSSKISTESVFNYKRFFNKLILHIDSKMPSLPMETHAKPADYCGINMLDIKTTKIGYEGFFDNLNPQDITIGARTIITSGVKILSHFASGNYCNYIFMERGNINIGSNIFIGMNTVIAKPVLIGNGGIISANSGVICDIPAFQIWSGNSTKFIKNRGGDR